MLHLNLGLLFVEVLCTLKVVFLLFKKTILASVAPGEHTIQSVSAPAQDGTQSPKVLTAATALYVSCV